MSDQIQETPDVDSSNQAMRIIMEQLQSKGRIDYKEIVKITDASDVLVFSQMHLENDRTAAIIGGSFIENELEKAVRSRLLDDNKIIGSAFEPDRIFGSYGKKTRVGMMLGIYTKNMLADLDAIGKIRNTFAHDVKITSFSDEKILSLCNNLNMFKTNVTRGPEGKGLVDQKNRYGGMMLVGGLYDRAKDNPKERFTWTVQLVASHLRQIYNNPQRPQTADHFERAFGDDPAPSALPAEATLSGAPARARTDGE